MKPPVFAPAIAAVATAFICFGTQAQTSPRSLDLPAAPGGDAATVATNAIKKRRLPCEALVKAERNAAGHVIAVCKTPGQNPSHVYKDQTRYRIVSKNSVGVAQVCTSTAEQPQIVCN